MRLVVAAAGALGLALLLTGIPPLRRVGLAARVDPFLNGLGGRPADLSAGAGASELVAAIARVAGPLFSKPAPDLQSRLQASGSDLRVAAFRAERVLWALAGMGIALGLVMTGGGFVDPGGAVVASCAGALVGAGAREHGLRRAIWRRMERVRTELPVAIDLLTLALMAGEEVTAALGRVGALLDGEVGRELRSVVGTIRSGSSPASALGDLSVRLSHPAARRLVDCLVLAMERGAPLADALRVQADDLRTERLRDLLAMGGRREVAMLIPVVFLILPTIVAFVLLPGLVSLDLMVP